MARKTDTRDKLLDIALQLIMSRGYNATSIEEICQLADVTKGGFFYYFKTKEILGTEVIKYYWEKRKRQFSDVDWTSAESPLVQIQQFLVVVADVFMSDPKGYSCVAGSFAQELATTQPVFQELTASIFVDWAEQIRPVLQAAIESSHSPQITDVNLLTDHIISVIEGALVLALARQNPQVIEQQLRLLSISMQSLLPQ